MSNLLHVLQDEKVTDQIIENFDLKSESFFLILKNERELKFVKKQSQNIFYTNNFNNNLDSFILNNNIKFVIVHFLQVNSAKLILDIKVNITIAWYVWGADIYSLPRIKPTIYSDKTNLFLRKQNKKLVLQRKIKKNKILRKFYYNFVLKKEDQYEIQLKAIKKIKYFISFVEEDFHRFKLFYPTYKLKFLYCPILSIDQYIIDKEIKVNDFTKNILVGNSNTPENNHIDIIHQLKLNNNEMKSVNYYFPLSYGEDLEYKTFVCKLGTEILGKQFLPLNKFMEKKEYIDILKSCSTGIFYHYRQQAMGNIIAMLFMGSRIYLSKNNPVFLYFKRIGIIVFDFDSEFKIYRNENLTNSEIKNNQNLLYTLFSKRQIHEDIEHLIRNINDI